MEISAKVVADSVSDEGVRILTINCSEPRFILAEINTHRVLTRNGASSRAIPFKKTVEAVRDHTARPLRWLKNQPGMVATEELPEAVATECDDIWYQARESAIHYAGLLADRNVAKQYVNRLIEPFVMTRTLITSTHWANLLKLRDHPTAQPEFEALAKEIRRAIEESTPVHRSSSDITDRNRWHLPYVDPDEFGEYELVSYLDMIPDEVKEGFEDVPFFDTLMLPLLIMSAARCARLSYHLFDGKPSTFEDDLRTFTKLWTDPLHASPMEHQGIPLLMGRDAVFFGNRTGNFNGWCQLRKYLPNECAVDETIPVH